MSLRIISWTDDAFEPLADDSAMTIGVFDGVHLGHQALINRVVRRGPNPTLVTFMENPKKLVSPEVFEGDISSLNQKLCIFGQMGICQVILIDFSEKFSRMNGWEFLEILSCRGRMVFLAIGSNFRCGHRQGTGAESIREINDRRKIPTDVVMPVVTGDAPGSAPVNSSRIRAAILAGELKLAAALMGRKLELDLSGMLPDGLRFAGSQPGIGIANQRSGGAVYDFRTARRIIPPSGKYPVLINPGVIEGEALINGGKLYLPPVDGVDNYRAESLEFL